MRTWINILRIKWLNWRARSVKINLQLKYKSPKCDVCIITAGPMKESLSFQTSMTEGVVPAARHKDIRQLVGSNALMLYGFPQHENDIPYIKLMLTWSAIKVLKSSVFKFRREWKGQSKAGDTVVVKYIV